MLTRAECIERASRSPLLDAAFLLWVYKSEIDQEENLNPKNEKESINNEKYFQKIVSQILNSITLERNNAEFGATFDRLKLAHPNEKPSEIRSAIKYAVKFDVDCLRFFEYSDNFLNDADRAVALAAEKNPGFSESTLSWAAGRLMQAMR